MFKYKEKSERTIFSELSGVRMLFIAAAFFIFGLILLIFGNFRQYDFFSEAVLPFFFLSVTVGVLGLLLITASRLDIIQNSKRRDRIETEILKMKDSIKEVQSELKRSIETITSRRDLEELSEEIFKSKIELKISEISLDKIVSMAKDEIVAKYNSSIFKENGFIKIREKIDLYIEGVHVELRSQRRAANQNLLWGIVFAVFGIFVMGIFLFGPIFLPNVMHVDPGGSGAEWGGFARGFIPKLTFVIIFESVAFFFLQAYADDRGMIKYLRNEATNFESRSIALLSSIYFGERENQEKIFAQMMSTERNYTIKKGEKLITEAISTERKLFFEEFIKNLVPKIGENKNG